MGTRRKLLSIPITIKNLEKNTEAGKKEKEHLTVRLKLTPLKFTKLLSMLTLTMFGVKILSIIGTVQNIERERRLILRKLFRNLWRSDLTVSGFSRLYTINQKLSTRMNLLMAGSARMKELMWISNRYNQIL